jgi:hypothetical protein
MSKLLIDVIPFSMTPKQINESISNNNGRLIVEGVSSDEQKQKIKMVEFTLENF